MNLQEMIETRKASLAAADALAKKPDITEEEKGKLDALIQESRSLKADIDRAAYLIEAQREQEDAEKRAAKPVERRSSHETQVERKTDIRVRSKGFRHGALRSFRGSNAESDAFASGQWLLATIGNMPQAQEWCSQNMPEWRAMSVSSNSAGGVLVPDAMEQAIIDLREERGVARKALNVRPMSGDTLTVPRRTSGPTAYFVAENGSITTSDMAFDNIQLTARKLASLTLISSELNEDSIVSIADMLAMEIAYAFADKEDECLFNGSGTSTYGGVVGLKSVLNAGAKYTAITGNTAFSTLDLDDFEAMVGKLPQYAVNGAAWYISRVGWANSMLRLAEAAGGNTVNNVAAGAQLQFLGFPVVITQVMNSTTSAQTSTDGLCYLANLNQAAVMGSRRGVTVQSDSSRYFEYDQIAIRGTERFDIVVHDKGTSTVAGGVVMLSTPSS